MSQSGEARTIMPRQGRRTRLGLGMRPPTPPPNPTDSLETKLLWWLSIQEWLQHLKLLIDESLSKEFEDITTRRHPLTDHRGSVVVMRTVLVGEDIKGNDINTAQEELQSCDYEPYTYYDPCFYHDGLSCPGLMNRTMPTVDDMRYLSGFVKAHESHLYVHWEHLDYLSWEIIPELISQVESKIEELKMILEYRVPNFEEGVAPREEEEEIGYYSYDESEEDYPDYSDEDEEISMEAVNQHFKSLGDDTLFNQSDGVEEEGMETVPARNEGALSQSQDEKNKFD